MMEVHTHTHIYISYIQIDLYTIILRSLFLYQTYHFVPFVYCCHIVKSVIHDLSGSVATLFGPVYLSVSLFYFCENRAFLRWLSKILTSSYRRCLKKGNEMKEQQHASFDMQHCLSWIRKDMGVLWLRK